MTVSFVRADRPKIYDIPAEGLQKRYDYVGALSHNSQYRHPADVSLDGLTRKDRKIRINQSTREALQEAFELSAELGTQYNYISESELESDISEVIELTMIRNRNPEKIGLLPASPGRVKTGPDLIMVDSGCPFDLIGHEDCAGRLWLKEPLEQPIGLETANGFTEATHTIPTQSRVLGENLNPILLKSTPAVISLGLRCMEYGYDFIWLHGKNPYLITPTGRKVELVVINYVPYLDEGGDYHRRVVVAGPCGETSDLRNNVAQPSVQQTHGMAAPSSASSSAGEPMEVDTVPAVPTVPWPKV